MSTAHGRRPRRGPLRTKRTASLALLLGFAALLLGFAALLLGFAALLLGFAACSGEHVGPGEITAAALPEPVVTARARRQTDARDALAAAGKRQILFGDLHVHTAFSPDAFITSLPMLGGSGLHPPADACDFARFCADLDFWSINDHAEGISPQHWRETIESIQQCNAVARHPTSPDLVSFLGWEWTQVGSTPGDHFGHKNVVLLDTAADRVPRRPIAAPRPEFRAAPLPGITRLVAPLLNFGDRQLYFDYQRYTEEVQEAPLCARDIPSPELPDTCHEVARDPSELFDKLDEWGFESLVIPHGTSWGLMTPTGFSLARPLAAGHHDPERERLFELYSGHGSAETWHDQPGGLVGVETPAACPPPSDEFLPCCWQAGEIIRGRCGEPASADCEARVREARRIYLEAGAAGHTTVPGAGAAEWLDCDQCRDCFNPAFSHRPGGSAQYALAITRGGSAAPRRYRFGMIGSSDTHDARAGNGFKEFSRVENTEASDRPALMRRLAADRREPVARAESVILSELPLSQRRDMERGASFLFTGGLVAVHADGRNRRAIWDALMRREVYATSGERILLWFDLLNGPSGPAPMGSEVRGQRGAPRLRVAAVGAFEQRPGCPDHVMRALPPERLEALCLGECYFPGERRHAIQRIEVVRIRAQQDPSEPVSSLIEDPWRIFPCPGDGAGCSVEFEDPQWLLEAREFVYYARAIQEPTPAVNAGGLRCTRDASGTCIAVNPCWGDDRTPAGDDCLADNEERAWSSPIFLQPAEQ
ncbi:MAG TPA: DUF3604 domain-containing protein [Myxococcota bacterium]|jgi:hypothetical protein|nr:DUF3604 domain-containing protein [Myxococcota bacterium]MDP7299293.1 DUF3604 domain-containing protein [Myxococcota bacterium]HJO24294.1 DUF3604 domain-containing protein [Myxococcota bacterium]